MEAILAEMDLHPNWVGLATVDFERKIFLRAGENNFDAVDTKKKKNAPIVQELTGEEAKQVYLDILSSSGGLEKPKPPPEPPRVVRAKIEAPVEVVPLNDRILRRFLLAAQQNDVYALKDTLKTCPEVLNASDEFGWTALMCSVQAKAVDSIKWLVNNKADVFLKENTGKTAVTLAGDNTNIIYILTRGRNQTSVVRRERRENPQRFKKITCDICRGEYYENERHVHVTSTIHALSSSKNTIPKTYYGIPESNRGYQLLLRNGWDREQGLGPSGSGKKFPLKTVHKIDRHGIGIKTDPPRVTHSSESIMKKHRDRFANLRRGPTRKEIVTRHNYDKYVEKKIRNSLS